MGRWRWGLCGLIVGLAAATAPVVRADTRITKVAHGYTIANGVVRFSPLNIVDIGGYRFPATGDQPFRVEVEDASGTDSPFHACQDPNGDGECGGTGEPNAYGCGDVFLPGFDRGLPVSVLVAAASIPTVPPDCLGATGTTGVITLWYARFD